ncbi:MAG: Smr/MutS family protein [Spirochaetaceae bacterium]|nr:Smr/MutS family protein [Spirochaetaceae bacterium]
MDFGDILNQWDELCSKEEKVQKDKIRETNKPRPRLPNAPSLSGNQAVSKKDASFQDFEKTGGQVAQEDSLPRVNPMDLWLRRYGVMDKDALAKEVEERERNQNREYLKKMPAGARIDLHGLTRDEAWERLDAFIGDCSRRGIQKVLIVHGKGHHSKERADVSVLSSMVRTFIELDRRLGASGHPDKRLGGDGATWVIIKK